MNEPKQNPITDDPDLAKVLADHENEAKANGQDSGLSFEETPVGSDANTPAPDVPTPPDDSALESAVDSISQSPPSLPEPPTAPNLSAPTPTSGNSDLEGIKKDALSELRPLVEKLTLPADEKFDIMLLIIRSTDDLSLVGAAHEAAKTIEDDTKRAQALLDIVKEIDYFAAQQAA